MRRARAFLNRRLLGLANSIYSALSMPAAVIFLFAGAPVHPAYRISWAERFRLALRMHRNTRRVFTGTSYKAHLAMAVKLLEIPPEVEGDVVECGCFLGGSTANLSLVCRLAGRKLIVYDSFEGMPPPRAGDRHALPDAEGKFRGGLEEVRENVRRLGDPDRCTFIKGWFRDTLPRHESPIVLCYLDVDHQASLFDCIVNLWPHLTEQGLVFIDEYVYNDYCALFFSERFWREHFDTTPPGLLGAGTGVGLGDYFLGPESELIRQLPGSVAYTRKDFRGDWSYYPDEREPVAG